MKNKIIVVGNAVSNKIVLEKISKKYDLEILSADEFQQETRIYTNTLALWIHFDTYLSSNYLEKIREIPFLISTTTGLTHISHDIQSHYSHKLISLKGRTNFLKNITSTAEHAWILIMLSNSRFNNAIKSVQDGEWKRQAHLRDRQISSQTLGIIGFGRLGKMVANYGQAFGMKVLIHDIDSDACKEALDLGFSTVKTLGDLMLICDIVSLHANFEPFSDKIISTNELELITKPTAIVNTARAGLVDEEAIIKAIESKPYLQYLTDVMAFEENGSAIKESKLWNKSRETKRITITPHLGGANKEAIELCEEELYKAFLSQLVE